MLRKIEENQKAEGGFGIYLSSQNLLDTFTSASILLS